MSRSSLRTKPIKGLLILLAVVFLCSAGLLAYFIYDRSTIFISILVYIFAGAFILISLYVFLDQLFHYLEVKGNALVKHVFWNRYVLPFDKIKSVTLDNGMYEISSKRKKFYVMPAYAKGSSEIIIYLENHGVSLSEKTPQI